MIYVPLFLALIGGLKMRLDKILNSSIWVPVLLILCSVDVNASPGLGYNGIDWHVNQHGVAVTSNPELQLAIVNSSRRMWFVTNTECISFGYKRDTVITINNQPVKAVEVCNDDYNAVSYVISTDNGINFAFDQFSKGRNVFVNGMNFSAIGFNKAVGGLLNRGSAI